MRKSLNLLLSTVVIIIAAGTKAEAQQYKLRQTNSMMGMKSESTIYVKGMRKRTEPGSMMGMPPQPVTIEQCDLQRTIKINDKKKLYYIETFTKETDEIIEEDAKPAVVKNKPVTTVSNEKGGVINMWYTITDTGERKKMSGFTARHVWTSQKIKPSPQACTMKDSIIIKTDGWYIDLPEFNCPINYRPTATMAPPNQKQPECKDRFVTHRSGKGKLGFPLTETRTIIMGNASAKTSEMVMSLETLEFSTTKLDSMLFEIPPGYQQTMDESELQEKFNMNDMMKQVKANQIEMPEVTTSEEKAPGKIRVGVYEPKGDGQLQASSLQQHLVGILRTETIEAIAVANEDEAKKYNCDYTLATDFIKIKQGSKLGGLLKAVKNTDPNAASSFTMEAGMNLVRLADGSSVVQPKLNGKYDGKIDDAAKKVLDEGSGQVLKALK